MLFFPDKCNGTHEFPCVKEIKLAAVFSFLTESYIECKKIIPGNSDMNFKSIKNGFVSLNYLNIYQFERGRFNSIFDM